MRKKHLQAVSWVGPEGMGERVQTRPLPPPFLENHKWLYQVSLKNSGTDTFKKNYFRKTIREANSLHPDQTLHSVRPDLGPNFFQRLSAEDTSR